MHDTLLSLAVISCLLAGTILVGRTLVLLLRIGFLSRWIPENVMSAAFLGTACLILPFGYCSYLGMPAMPASLVVLTLAAALLICRGVFVPKRIRPEPGRWRRFLIVAIPIILGIALCLLPVFVGNCYIFHNDTFIYDSFAEWLQENGMRHQYTPDPERPHWIFVSMLQGIGHRMGPIFLLAMIESLCPNTLAIDVFESVTAWGVALNLAGVYLLCRWSFRCSQRVAFLAMLIAAGLNPLWLSSTNGFLCQIYGTAALLFYLAVLTRLIPRSRWNVGNAAILAIAAALLTSVYSELMPVLTGATIAWLGISYLRDATAANARRQASFAVGTGLCYLFIANIEIFRAVKAIRIMANVNGVGAHLDWSPLQYWAFVMGAKRFPNFTKIPLHFFTFVALGVATSFFLLGLIGSVRSMRSWPTLTALFLLACLGAYFRWYARDPWSGAIGHTWNQFKLCKWSYLLVVVIQAAGINAFTRRRPWVAGSVLPVVCLAFFVTDVWRACHDVKFTITNYHELYHSQHPLASLRSLRRQIDEINPSLIYFFAAEKDPLRSMLIPYLLTPRSFWNSWPADCFAQSSPVKFSSCPTGMIGLMYGDPPFEKAKQELACGVCLIDLQHSLIASIDKHTDRRLGLDNQLELGIGPGESCLELWSPQAGNASFSFDLHPCKAESFIPPLQLHLVIEGKTKRELTIACSGSAIVPIDATAGLTRLRISCVDGVNQHGSVADSSPFVYMTHCHFSPERP